MAEKKYFTTDNRDWDFDKSFIDVPDNCISAVFKNDGDTLIRVDEVNFLEPGQAYKIGEPGFYLTGRVNVKSVNEAAPYGTNKKVIVRFAVEVEKK
jgi:hypothetical protein